MEIDFKRVIVVAIVFVLLGAAAGHLYTQFTTSGADTRSSATDRNPDSETGQTSPVHRLAGYAEVSGAGVVIELKDAVREREETETLIIHDTDLLNLVNELRAAGAKGISIASGDRERRLTALTPVRCVGPTVVVGDERLASPFEIRAVGDPEVLESSLLMQGGAVENLREFGIGVTVRQNNNLTLPAAPGDELE